MKQGDILGAYRSIDGGRIDLNLAGGLETDMAEATVFHEECHAWLSRTTALGVVQSMIEAEAQTAADLPYAKGRLRCAQVLAEKTRRVQEIFATNMELLKVQKLGGEAAQRRVFAGLPAEYQAYYLAMEPVHRMNIPVTSQMQAISALCACAMNVVLPPGSTQTAERMDEALRGARNPDVRLRAALDAFLETGKLPDDAVDMQQVQRMAEEAAPGLRTYIREGFAQAPGVLEALRERQKSGDPQALDREITDRMLRRVCLFSPSVSADAAWKPVDLADRAALLRPIAAEDGSFPYARLLVWQDGYREETVRTENLKARLRRCPFPFMLFSGYREAPALMAQYAGHAAVQTVIFQTQEECEDWLLEDRRLETVYVGEIRTAAGRSDICVLFFSLRESPGTIFVFPTLGCIRENLFGGTHLQARCVEADDRMFLRVFAALGDEVQIMRYLTGLMEMLLGRSWTEISRDPHFSRLINRLVETAFNSALASRRRDEIRVAASLPQKETRGEPFYCLMRFEGEINTGDTEMDGSAGLALLFLDRETAGDFARRFKRTGCAAGIDRIYWPYFYEMVQAQKGVVVLVQNGQPLIGRRIALDTIADWFGLPKGRDRSPPGPGGK